MTGATMYSICGRPPSCSMSCWLRSWSADTRVTSTPAAVEMISAGICATRPSPMVSNV